MVSMLGYTVGAYVTIIIMTYFVVFLYGVVHVLKRAFVDGVDSIVKPILLAVANILVAIVLMTVLSVKIGTVMFFMGVYAALLARDAVVTVREWWTHRSEAKTVVENGTEQAGRAMG